MSKFQCSVLFFLFFFQAEDGIRDTSVTGVQTCALPICLKMSLLAEDIFSGFVGLMDINAATVKVRLLPG